MICTPTPLFQFTVWRETLVNSLHEHIRQMKIWQICEILRVKNISEIYSVKHSEHLHQSLWCQKS